MEIQKSDGLWRKPRTWDFVRAGWIVMVVDVGEARVVLQALERAGEATMHRRGIEGERHTEGLTGSQKAGKSGLAFPTLEKWGVHSGRPYSGEVGCP